MFDYLPISPKKLMGCLFGDCTSGDVVCDDAAPISRPSMPFLGVARNCPLQRELLDLQ